MSMAGRGRGYTGNQNKEPKPGKESIDHDAVRILAELSPRSPDPSKLELKKQEMRVKEPVESSEPLEPQQLLEKPDIKHHISAEDDASLQELLTIDETYRPLLVLLEQFSPGEDGIQFNRKLRHFESTVTSMCPDEARLQHAFASFRAAALGSAVSARQLAAVGASFTRQQRQHPLRAALLNVVMQGTFSKLDVLEKANPIFLINAANLMGDYFAEARLCNGNKVHIVASPLLQYMKALLTSNDIRAHRSLATQLMQNGRELLSVLSQELDELSISIRLRLLSPPPFSIIWLLLSADLCLNKFLPLPNTLQQFYAAHLDLTTDENFSEVSYGSWKRSPEKEKDCLNLNSSGSEIGGMNLSQISLTDESDSKPKLRPILGAGAGLLRQEQAFSVGQEGFDNWSKTSLTKRYDLNSWRQQDEPEEPVFNPSVLPPNLSNPPPQAASAAVPPTANPNYPITVPNYPPPAVPNLNNYQDQNFPNYLQQGDGTFIQNQNFREANFSSQGDGFGQQFPESRTPLPLQESEKVSNEVQKSSRSGLGRQVENWRREKSDLKEDSNKNRQQRANWQQSADSINDDDDDTSVLEDRRSNSRNSREGRGGNKHSGSDNDSTVVQQTAKGQQRRHVSDVPRSQKYWDHDDRCDRDYEVN